MAIASDIREIERMLAIAKFEKWLADRQESGLCENLAKILPEIRGAMLDAGIWQDSLLGEGIGYGQDISGLCEIEFDGDGLPLAFIFQLNDGIMLAEGEGESISHDDLMAWIECFREIAEAGFCFPFSGLPENADSEIWQLGGDCEYSDFYCPGNGTIGIPFFPCSIPEFEGEEED